MGSNLSCCKSKSHQNLPVQRTHQTYIPNDTPKSHIENPSKIRKHDKPKKSESSNSSYSSDSSYSDNSYTSDSTSDLSDSPKKIFNFDGKFKTHIKGKDLHNVDLYKVTNKEETHNGHKFKTGFNVDTRKTFPSSGNKLIPRGFNIFQYNDLKKWLKYKKVTGYYIRRVKVDNDSDVFVLNGRFKCTEIYLEDRVKISDFNFD